MLNELAKQLHENSLAKGFYEDFFELLDVVAMSNGRDLRNHVVVQEVNTKMLLIISELSEIVEAIRAGATYSDVHVQEEFADVGVRFLDLCAFLDIDIDNAIERKAGINNDRPYKHNKAF